MAARPSIYNSTPNQRTMSRRVGRPRPTVPPPSSAALTKHAVRADDLIGPCAVDRCDDENKRNIPEKRYSPRNFAANNLMCGEAANLFSRRGGKTGSWAAVGGGPYGVVRQNCNKRGPGRQEGRPVWRVRNAPHQRGARRGAPAPADIDAGLPTTTRHAPR